MDSPNTVGEFAFGCLIIAQVYNVSSLQTVGTDRTLFL